MDDPGGVPPGQGVAVGVAGDRAALGEEDVLGGEGTIMSWARAQNRSTASSGKASRCSADQ
nr:hypothetical protein [Streptomyces marispadix]